MGSEGVLLDIHKYGRVDVSLLKKQQRRLVKIRKR